MPSSGDQRYRPKIADKFTVALRDWSARLGVYLQSRKDRQERERFEIKATVSVGSGASNRLDYENTDVQFNSDSGGSR